MTRPGVALIGAGMIAKTHVSALSALQSRCRLAAIVSTRPERAEYLSAFYQGPSPQFTNDLSAVLKAPDIDFVIVATPPNVRLDLIESLTKAGKHILLEKPIARNLHESRQVIDICKRANVELAVVFQHRMWDSSIAAKQVVASGDLGKIGLIEITAPLWRPQTYYDELGRGTYTRDGGGVLITQAIHTIDLALSLTGPVSRVQAMTATTSLHNMESEDFAVVGLTFASGAVGSLIASTATFPRGKESIALNGICGSLHLSADSMDVHWQDGQITHYIQETKTEETVNSKSLWHKRIIENFIDCIEHGNAPMVSGHDAFSSHRLIEAIEVSSRTGHSVDIE
ncbi:MAG: Gfo/Idh/MocA family protein [Granulosicoccus sp.]